MDVGSVVRFARVWVLSCWRGVRVGVHRFAFVRVWLPVGIYQTWLAIGLACRGFHLFHFLFVRPVQTVLSNLNGVLTVQLAWAALFSPFHLLLSVVVLYLVWLCSAVAVGKPAPFMLFVRWCGCYSLQSLTLMLPCVDSSKPLCFVMFT